MIIIIILSTADNVAAVSTLLFCDRHKESEYLNSVSCVCVKEGETRAQRQKAEATPGKDQFLS